ncbi:respiratory nitrate reductase subunit gamma [Candidatus Venteria ishoeyi]|uniref:Nitrate reductase gamma subunit n=1 Tax=Candidatus Venteria ishoeyi TaxID=1899563 RepID=A0A1H6FGA8_9GAMM|nr:respiratory nitrate reductase subunit gamma [Candidatus Venteria ishoeyi]MDM8547557.1 respiratory nitrate reductase subunit gamma [Candidatus Venteria ishoeyi]SEH08379.1 Nitrate reductase gamma subunit [Candidatus Venteria ishoeyi]
MWFLTGFFALFFYLAVIIFVAGVGFKIYQYIRTPAPLKIPTMPAPLTRTGVGVRLFSEVVLFKSLFRANKWIWLFGWIFHFALLLVLLRHLRYFIDPVWWWVALIQPFGKYAAFAMILGLVGLLVRRITVERIRYISNPSDYLMLALLLIIGISGAMMTFVAHTDIMQFKAFVRGMMTFSWQPIPTDPALLLHLAAVFLLMIVFPYSKLLHAPGIFFSPSRNQVDNPREKRHLAPWAAEMEKAERSSDS